MGRVTKEVRGLAMELAIPFVSAIQSNRSGIGLAELDLTNVGESLGFVKTADIVVAVTQTEEMRSIGKYRWMLLKNRYGINKISKTVSVSFEFMRVSDDEDSIIEKEIKTAETTKEKVENAVESVNKIINRNSDKKRKKFFDFE